VALVIVAVWTRVDGQVETAASTTDRECRARPLAEEQVVARGEIDGKP
jgi:hypothetical protein